MISHRYRCIYIKVPRCGSTSLRDWFLDHGSGRHSFKPCWYGGLLPDRIQSVTRLMNLYPDYATFTFVRDPYERFVSLYLLARPIPRETAAGRGRGLQAPGPDRVRDRDLPLRGTRGRLSGALRC
ncbi:sulfotransferase family 2 domain-containing protein [Candidatus Palauibacter sp.]|uniref:sulfotransferase family 2 domain-containing protein n=1 Tax=Candidatus Palauibacter sp. TaxID=3101350 RepID=UPI003CC63A2F